MRKLRYVRLTGKQRLFIWLALFVTLLMAVVIGALVHMGPIISSMATARVSNTVNRIVVEAVSDAIQGGEIDYGVLVEFEKDASGHVTALKSNMAAFNRLQSRISDDILLRLSEEELGAHGYPAGEGMEHQRQMILIHSGTRPTEYLPHEVITCVGAKAAHDADRSGFGQVLGKTLDQNGLRFSWRAFMSKHPHSLYGTDAHHSYFTTVTSISTRAFSGS